VHHDQRQAPIPGHAKGPAGWFPIEQMNLAYDHPAHSASEHAVLLDFANEEIGSGARLAVELPVEAATQLAHCLLQIVDEANRYEAATEKA
jgi:hypothetical protein